MRSLSRRYVDRVIAPESEILSFAQPLESIQRKGGSITASSCAPRFCRGSVERASCPPTDARHPCRAPVVANPTKPAVLNAANENKTWLLRNIS